MKVKYLTFLLLGLLNGLFAIGQINYQNIKGIVKAKDGAPLPQAVVMLDGRFEMATTSDLHGNFEFEKVEIGNHVLVCRFVGYEDLHVAIKVSESSKNDFLLVMEEEQTMLNSVTITDSKDEMNVLRQVQQVELLEAKEFYHRSLSPLEAVGMASGVHIRQTGGMGSQANISLNGMSGKQVATFIDGIPAEFYGQGMSLGNMPIEFMDKVELYKGIVPAYLGGDALGGAINIVSRQEYQKALKVSYGFGSFNTHKANFHATLLNNKKSMLLGAYAFLNYSDNDYEIDAQVPDQFYNPVDTIVNRFHDRFQNGMIRLEVGFVDQSWADYLLISLAYTDLSDQIQHNAMMSQPYGQAERAEQSYNAMLKYGYAFGDLDIDLAVGKNWINSSLVDTTLNVYTWDGDIQTQRAYGGELSTSMNTLDLITNTTFSRLNATYRISPLQLLNVNSTLSNFSRSGSDSTANAYYGFDPFENEMHMLKHVLGLAYELHSTNKKWAGVATLKHYFYQAEGFEQNRADNEVIIYDQKESRLGYSLAVQHKLLSIIDMKMSYEYATRLPDVYELFGDHFIVKQNMNLSPETSHNVNLGTRYNSEIWSAEVNGFFRKVDDIIYLKSSPFFAQYQNLLKAEVKGVELGFSILPIKHLTVESNATFQDIRNKSSKVDSNTSSDKYFNERLPNRPYFFSNHSIGWRKNKFSCWWNGRYVEEFYLHWEVDGRKESKPTIPRQFIQNIGASYTIWENQLTLSLESFNVTDQRAYDHFKVQKPGRSFAVKARYVMNR
ncbi:TonB-dependent receptor [Aureibacter tunicatorum]|uniref:Outer membrane cobalamin receptor n=1 Tax=Aureibacter tunicatorum TaxID=866807 RepID=A0AAE3XSM7_9BACT|nr:TonB-dependent receptor [Aureibacter tunicatorum]MDR6242028.1 outer membrane cobalamin receptor [Aureibacter tunicatorum]BDD07127.1 TonB-dependent receptor [Aureibacter tunicatorum]